MDKFYVIPSKIPERLYCRSGRADFKINMVKQRSLNSPNKQTNKPVLTKNNKARGLTVPNFKM